MKFLCEHCKAKYQIADEKVAGRTVRMKCRKCGNPIEVRAAVTETSVNAKLPTDPPPPHPAGAAEAAKAPRPGRTPLATSLSSAPKPAPARPAAPRSGEGGSLAGAFHRNVQQKEEEISVALDLRELSAADEWYVAINGVPVGPIRVAELRRKAAIGVVTEESLCWQEGMEEWRPVRAVAELAALVREAAVGGRVSLVTPPPPEARPGFMGAPARPGSSRPLGGAGAPLAARAPRPGVAPAPNAWSNVVPITSRLATAEKLNEEPARFDAPHGMVAADPFASPAPPAPSPFLPTSAGGFGTSDFAAAPVVPGTATPSIAAPPPEKRPPPFIAIAMIVLAAAFGVTAAIVLLKPAPQVVVQVPGGASPPPQAAPTVVPTTTAAAPAATDSAAAAPSSSSTPGKIAAAPGKTGGSTSPGKGQTAADPGLQALIQGAAGGNGPSAGPGGGTGGGAGAELTSDQVQSVLQSHQVGLKRTCWDRVQTQSSTVNETVHIVVGASGQVSSASASGNDPVVGHCIESEVRRWSFPGSGEINIPFHFLRQ